MSAVAINLHVHKLVFHQYHKKKKKDIETERKRLRKEILTEIETFRQRNIL